MATAPRPIADPYKECCRCRMVHQRSTMILFKQAQAPTKQHFSYATYICPHCVKELSRAI